MYTHTKQSNFFPLTDATSYAPLPNLPTPQQLAIFEHLQHTITPLSTLRLKSLAHVRSDPVALSVPETLGQLVAVRVLNAVRLPVFTGCSNSVRMLAKHCKYSSSPCWLSSWDSNNRLNCTVNCDTKQRQKKVNILLTLWPKAPNNTGRQIDTCTLKQGSSLIYTPSQQSSSARNEPSSHMITNK